MVFLHFLRYLKVEGGSSSSPPHLATCIALCQFSATLRLGRVHPCSLHLFLALCVCIHHRHPSRPLPLFLGPLPSRVLLALSCVILCVCFFFFVFLPSPASLPPSLRPSHPLCCSFGRLIHVLSILFRCSLAMSAMSTQLEHARLHHVNMRPSPGEQPSEEDLPACACLAPVGTNAGV